MKRRSFLQTTACAGAAGVAFPHLLRGAPNATIAVGIIGASRAGTGAPGRGAELALALTGLPGVEIAHVCDVDATYLAKTMQELAQKGQRPQAQRDFRRILDDKRVDAVVIATPDHWHVPATLLALAAGKHVYLETPGSHSGEEGGLLVAAAQKYGRVVQHGTQRRSWPAVQEAVAKLRAKTIGRLISAKAVFFAARPTIGHGEVSAPPPELDWTLWQGPSPEHAFQRNFVPSNWRWMWQWGNGEIGNNGVHLLDLCRWGLDLKAPARTSSGGVKTRFPDDQETPDQQTANFDFSGEAPLTISWEARSWAARTLNDPKFDVAFYGEEGSLLITGSAYSIHDLNGRETARGAGTAGTDGHLRNFIDSIRGTAKLNSPIDDGVQSALMCHLANISWRLNHTIVYNAARGQIVNDLDADALWHRKYRDGWTPTV